MSYDAREKSWEAGRPLEYYDFVRGTQHWRYNTSDRVLTRGASAYLPLAIKRDRIQQGVERNKLALSIELPSSADVASLWRPYPTSKSVGLTIYGAHNEESESAVVWIGRVVSPKFKPDLVTIIGEPSTTVARKVGQIQCWQRPCPHVLYKQGHGLCNANKNSFKVVGTVAAAAGVLVESTAFASAPDGRLAGGYMTWVAPSGQSEIRSISKHVGNKVWLFAGTDSLPIGASVTAYFGCRRNWSDCNDVFNNGVNYGGDLYAPQRSPFDGNPVY